METQASKHDSGSKPDDARSLVDFLRDRDAACPSCKYNLRGLTAPACPECGTRLVLGVQQAEPFLWAWIIATVGLALLAGLGLAILPDAARGRTPITLEFGMLNLFVNTMPLLSLPAVVLVIWFRRTFLRRSRSTQIIVAVAVVVLVAIQFGAILLELF